jgi:hypothetical protein
MPAVGARADEHAVDLAMSSSAVPVRGPCTSERPPSRRGPEGRRRLPGSSGTRPSRARHARAGAPRDLGASSPASSVDGPCRTRALVGAERAPLSTASSKPSPCGANLGRPFRYSNVVSSGAIIPARAPASIDMLQIVMRSSMERLRIAGPRYSMTWPTPPSTPIWPMIARARSLAVTPGPRRPSTSHLHRASGFAAAASGWRARARPPTCRCRRPAHRTHRAWRCASRRRRSSCPAACSPCSGPMMCTMPCRASDVVQRMPNWAAFSRSVSICCRGERVRDRQRPVRGGHVVVDSGEGEVRTPHLAARQPEPSNACGLSPRAPGAGRCRAACGRRRRPVRCVPPRACPAGSRGRSRRDLLA